MYINLFTITNNNEKEISDFIDFYKERIPSINIHINDMNSKDKTIEIAKEKGCSVRNFSDFYRTIDDCKNDCWKYKPCDCVVVCMINELIDITPLIFQNATLIMSKGYDVSDIKNLTATEENRNPNYDKICIFDPQSIREMNFDGFSCNPLGFLRFGEKNPIMYNLKK